MATPITHLFFADKLWNKYKKIDRFGFFAGNCLPDIRYVDKTIERENFHIRNLTIDDVLEEKSDFWKGVKFHSFVDENRDNFYEEQNVYIPKISDEILIRSLKFLEDDVLYSRLSFWQDFVKFLLEYEFPVYDIDGESLKKWKKILSDYFSVQPCNASRGNFIQGLGLTEDMHIEIEDMLENLRGKELQEVNDMIVFIENLI